MRRRMLAVTAVGIACFIGLARGVSQKAEVSSDIAALRAKGPAGLDELLLANADRIKLHLAKWESDPESWPAIATKIDQVAMQKDAWASRLFWYTDLNQATAAAKQSGKPILSLRLLGNLNDDLSCANSRFFRKTLYPDPKISAFLREHFVLHWQSVRPVPTITIDFGDGRTMHRTITGNSIHYVLNSNGEVIDGLPGLHGPAAFLRWLETTEKVSRDNAAALRLYHEHQAKAIATAWDADLKMVVAPLVTPTSTIGPPGERAIDDSTWQRIAQLHTADGKLDPAALALMRPDARAVARMSMSKASVEDPMIVAARNLSASIALDTVRNEYTLHRRLHEWLAQATPQRNVDPLNAMVYESLFFMPLNDPWCGLNPPDAYSAIDDDGTNAAVAEGNLWK